MRQLNPAQQQARIAIFQITAEYLEQQKRKAQHTDQLLQSDEVHMQKGGMLLGQSVHWRLSFLSQLISHPYLTNIIGEVEAGSLLFAHSRFNFTLNQVQTGPNSSGYIPTSYFKSDFQHLDQQIHMMHNAFIQRRI